MICDHLILQKIIKQSINQYELTQYVHFPDFHYTLCKLMLISKSWLLNILPKIKYPVLSIETKEEWEIVFTLIVKHKLPLRLTFSKEGIHGYIKGLSKPTYLKKLKQFFSSSFINVDQFFDLIGPHFHTLSLEDHYRMVPDPLELYFKSLEKQTEQELLVENRDNSSNNKSKNRFSKLKLRMYTSNFSNSAQLTGLPSMYRDNITDMDLVEIGQWDVEYSKIIANMRNLKYLSINIDNSSFSDQIGPSLENILQNKRLKRLSIGIDSFVSPLSSITIPSALVIYKVLNLQEFETALNQCQSLDSFFITFNDLEMERFNGPAQPLNISHTNLTNLNFSDPPFNWNPKDIINLPNLTELHINDQSFIQVPRSFPKMQFLELLKIKSLETLFANEGILHQFPKLEKLSIVKSNDEITALPKSSLTYLLSDNVFHQAIPQTVNQLSLSQFCFSIQDLTKLFSLMAENKYIRIFELTDSNQNSRFYHSAQEFDVMLQALEQNTQLTRFYFNENHFTNAEENTLLLFKVLECMNVTHFNFNEHVILKTDEAINRFKSSIIKNKHLLNLSIKSAPLSSFLNKREIVHYHINFSYT
ncbi:hypothetical protein CYY_001190 [Polysphondylium violaceum]|uniref:Uncharacterized protein n=1 Tax=Polysphondylium violaceum TaxID=133409 RepID=A0A8J4UWF4_9MYCE|nr:hypothetical protein CYY_001190 [Polysphondylium violaceum]